MKIDKLNSRIAYSISFIVILITEILIALFVSDAFIRPFGGDILVTILICCFVRMLFLKKIRFLAFGVFLFATAVEIGQYYDFVTLLGLGNSTFFRVLLGTSFSFWDLVCYACGCVIFFVCEKIFEKYQKTFN